MHRLIQRHRTSIAAVIILAAATLPATAALDPLANTPHELQVVLLVAEHRMLTPVFQDQLARTVQARLEQRLGKLARVDLVINHPLARAIHARGLGTLDGWEETSERQTVFLVVDFSQGRYELQARSYSGWIAAADAGVRRASTSDRLQVSDLAVALAHDAFTVAGTVTPAGKDIDVALRGGALGGPLERWISPGTVLAVSRVTKGSEGLRAARMPWTLLEVVAAPQKGVVRCRLWRRYQQDDLRDESGVLGYRCQALRGVQAPVRLRLIDDDTGAPLAGVPLQITQPGTKKKAELSSDAGGLAVTGERFSRFALVQVGQGASARAQFPVELVDERIVICRLKAQPEAELIAGLELRRDQWLRRVYDQLRVAGERVPELTLLLSKSLQAAREHAERGLTQIDTALEQLSQERDELARQARAKEAPAGRLDLAEGDQRLAELKTRREELQQFIARVEQVIQDAQSETTQGLAKLVERARLLEQDAEFDQAIALYEKVLEARPDQEKVKAHLDKLKAAWKPKDARHAQARAFLLQTWPRLEAGALGQHLKQAEESLAVCKEAGDRLTPRRLMQANTLHVGRLRERLEALRRQDTEDSRNQLKSIAQVADGLRRLHAEATALAEQK